jgi:hypothetical protein
MKQGAHGSLLTKEAKAKLQAAAACSFYQTYLQTTRREQIQGFMSGRDEH